MTIIIVATSFIHKDLNEYEKWLKFHDYNDEDFKQVGIDKQEKFEWTFSSRLEYPHTIYLSPDSIYIIDLRPVFYDNDSNLNVNPHFSIIQIIRLKDSNSSTLLNFNIDSGVTETAIWRNKDLFEIFGYTVINKKYVPTIWKYDIEKKTSKEFLSAKTFKTRPESYIGNLTKDDQ